MLKKLIDSCFAYRTSPPKKKTVKIPSQESKSIDHHFCSETELLMNCVVRCHTFYAYVQPRQALKKRNFNLMKNEQTEILRFAKCVFIFLSFQENIFPRNSQNFSEIIEEKT